MGLATNMESAEMPPKKHSQEYLESVKSLSDALVEAQSPIRILNVIKWPERVKEEFFKSNCMKQPNVDKSVYQDNINFDISEKIDQFREIEQQTLQQLGPYNTVGQMLRRMCQEYILVLNMLEVCGTEEFSKFSKLLFGSSKDVFHAGDPNINFFGTLMLKALSQIDGHNVLKEEPRNIHADKAIKILQTKLNKHFHESETNIRVLVSDGIVSDAAAGADYIKLRQDAVFNKRDLQLLEVHEGLVHVATTLNGALQPYCTFLSKGPPSSTITQEGLAVLMEIISFSSYPARLMKIAKRIRAIEMAEDGATFLDVFRFYYDSGYDKETAYTATTRVFRGSLPTLGPFTKDLAYSKGFVNLYNFLVLCVKKGRLDLIPLLFCGKTRLEDIRDLAQLQKEGLIKKPKFLPPQIKDLNAISAWLCFTSFTNLLSLEKIESDYDYLFNS